MAAALIDGKAVGAIKPLLITVGVMVGIGITGYLVYRAIKTSKLTKSSREEASASNSELNNLLVQGKKATLSNSQSIAVANALFTAMDGYGSDYGVIAREFAKINNDVDMLSVVKAFGVRTISSGRGNPSSNFTGTLQQALKDELDDSEVTALNNMLARKGIKNRL